MKDLRRLVFDADSWSKTGDIGDNIQFWKKALIVRIYHSRDGESLADVRFDDGRCSRGHILSMMREIPR